MAPYPSRARPGNARPRSTSSRAKAAKSARWAMDAPYRTSATGSLRALSADAASRATTGTVHGRSAGVVCGTGRGVIRISSGESSGADRRRQQQDRSTGLARMDPSDHVGGCGERMLSSCAQRLARTFHREIRILGPQAQAVRGRPEAVQDQHWRSLFRGAGARLTSVGKWRDAAMPSPAASPQPGPRSSQTAHRWFTAAWQGVCLAEAGMGSSSHVWSPL